MSGPAFVAPLPDGVMVRLTVTPRARRAAIGETIAVADGTALKVSVTAAPEGGKANEAVTDLLAREWRVARSALSLRHGAAARNKLLHLAGDPRVLQRQLDQWWQAHARRHAD